VDADVLEREIYNGMMTGEEHMRRWPKENSDKEALDIQRLMRFITAPTFYSATGMEIFQFLVVTCC
jgi:hypothetical protein